MKLPLSRQLPGRQAGSIPGSSTENTLVNVHFADLSVLHVSISSPNAA
jgi:hypothetical protein